MGTLGLLIDDLDDYVVVYLGALEASCAQPLLRRSMEAAVILVDVDGVVAGWTAKALTIRISSFLLQSQRFKIL